MSRLVKLRWAVLIESILLVVMCIVWETGLIKSGKLIQEQSVITSVMAEKEVIRRVQFKVSYEALCEAYNWDVKTYQDSYKELEESMGGKEKVQKKEAQEEAGLIHVNWIELLAYVGAKHSGEFKKNAVKEIKTAAKQLSSGEKTIQELTEGLNKYEYYYEAYEAVLGGFVGNYEIQEKEEDGQIVWKRKYGLKAFSPIAKGFPYHDYDDFGASRSYGYARPHLGHDMMGQVGTPIISVESGYVEALGWNQYGGWRIGIRSLDKKRYYYYAHLRQNFPYALDLKEGSVVTAGQVIGYMGHTGYSEEENVNNIEAVHLHWGMQLIFDESQKESDNEIWIDCYNLSRFLYRNSSETAKNEATKEWFRLYEMRDPVVLRLHNKARPVEPGKEADSIPENTEEKE